MNAPWSGVLRPFGLAAWFAPLPVIAAATWLIARPPAGASYDLWTWASAAVHDSLAISGPLLLLWSAALASTATGRAWVFSAVPAGVRVRQHLRIVLLTVSLGLLAHAVGLAPRLVFAARTATDGHLFPASILTAVAWVVLLCAVGAVCGYALSHGRWLLPLPFLAAVLLFIPAVYYPDVATLLPNKQLRPDAGTEPSWTVTLMVIALAAAVLVATVLVVGRRPGPELRVGQWSVGTPSLGLIAAVAAVVAVVVAAFAYQPAIYLAGPAATPVCRTIDSSRVCLHPAHVDSFPQVQAALVSLRAIGLDGYAPAVTDSSLKPDTLTTAGTDLILYVGPGYDERNMTRNAVYNLMVDACPTPTGYIGEEDTSPTTINFTLTAATLRTLGWDNEGSDSGVVADRLKKLTPAQLADLLRDRQPRVSTCSMRMADLP